MFKCIMIVVSVAVSCFIRPEVAVAGNDQPVAEAKAGDWSITGRPTKKTFGPKEALSFELLFKNVGKEPKKLAVTDYLGSQTVGRYNLTAKNVRTKETWQIGRDPTAVLPGAPARLRAVTLKVGDAQKTKFVAPLIGQRFWQGGTEKSPKKTCYVLPDGRYEMNVEVMKTKLMIPFSVGG